MTSVFISFFFVRYHFCPLKHLRPLLDPGRGGCHMAGLVRVELKHGNKYGEVVLLTNMAGNTLEVSTVGH